MYIVYRFVYVYICIYINTYIYRRANEYISKKVAAYGQFVLVIIETMGGGDIVLSESEVSAEFLNLQLNYAYF